MSPFNLSELDRVTPVYIHRMSRLTPHQRRVVSALAHHEGGARARDVARSARLDVHTVSTTLGRLADDLTWPDVFAPEPPGLSLLEAVEAMPRLPWVARVGKVGRTVRYRLVDERLGAWLRVRRRGPSALGAPA